MATDGLPNKPGCAFRAVSVMVTSSKDPICVGEFSRAAKIVEIGTECALLADASLLLVLHFRLIQPLEVIKTKKMMFQYLSSISFMTEEEL